MKIISREEINNLDKATIDTESITSIQLMERAASNFFHWMMEENSGRLELISILVGPGNNGGDGLVVARMSADCFKQVSLYVINPSDQYSKDFQFQYSNLPRNIAITHIKKKTDISKFKLENSLVIDGLFGTGLNREITGLYADVIQHVNNSNQMVYAIDIPSGLFMDDINTSDKIIRASKTGTFEVPKLSFFFIENYIYTGDWKVLPIGLNQEYLSSLETQFFLLDNLNIKSLIKKRKPYHHKGSFGHSLIVAGSEGMAGAAILATLASLRSGAGKTTAIIPDVCAEILQITIPEAMVQKKHGRSVLINFNTDLKIQAMGIGPGIGKNIKTIRALEDFLRSEINIPLVFDADALNIIAENKLIDIIPPNSILTPHPGEYSRLFGKQKNSLERIRDQITNSKKYNIYIIYKGPYTSISTPEGLIYFNHTGNPGMATAGSGDVLTGIITSLLAQQYSPLEACQIGVFIHGYAGDLAAEIKGYVGLIARDIIEQLPKAFKEFSSKN